MAALGQIPKQTKWEDQAVKTGSLHMEIGEIWKLHCECRAHQDQKVDQCLISHNLAVRNRNIRFQSRMAPHIGYKEGCRHCNCAMYEIPLARLPRNVRWTPGILSIPFHSPYLIIVPAILFFVYAWVPRNWAEFRQMKKQTTECLAQSIEACL